MEFNIYSPPIKKTIPVATITLDQLANTIRTDETLKSLTEQLRGLSEDKQKIFKAEKLPYVTFSGTFKKRSDDALIKHSGLICLDFDNIGSNGEIRALQQRITEHLIPALMFVSPRATGLKTVFSLDINGGEHAEYFEALRSFFISTLSIEPDKAARAISQACFLCYDPEAIYCDIPTVLNREFIIQYQDNSLIAETPVKDDTTQFEAARKWLDTQETFIQGNRNNYLQRLANTCNRYGISEDYTRNQLIKYAETDLTIKEIEAIVTSVYRHVERHAVADTLTKTNEQQTADLPYIRAGTNFFKVIKKKDRYGVEETHLKAWNQATLLQDFKRKVLHYIKKFDDFVMVPDNLNHQPIINNCYNLYAPFRHKPEPGDWIWTERLLRHVFGEQQYRLGIRYLQILYLHPDKSTIILVLVSKQRQTGKTTFCNWINMLFGANVALISSTDFLSGFNSIYATKNIVCIEETLLEKQLSIEKLKSLTTAKFITINEKYIAPYKVAFFGKVILTSNNETRFAKVDPEETRFLICKLGTPEFTNHNIETNLLQEIPAFLNYLQTLPPVDWSISRSGFTAEELYNTNLDEVIHESHSGLYKDCEIAIQDWFDNNKGDFFKASVLDLKQKFFLYDNQIAPSYIRKVLREEFNMTPGIMQRYYPFEDSLVSSKVGRPYQFYRQSFTNETIEDNEPPY